MTTGIETSIRTQNNETFDKKTASGGATIFFFRISYIHYESIHPSFIFYTNISHVSVTSFETLRVFSCFTKAKVSYIKKAFDFLFEKAKADFTLRKETVKGLFTMLVDLVKGAKTYFANRLS